MMLAMSICIVDDSVFHRKDGKRLAFVIRGSIAFPPQFQACSVPFQSEGNFHIAPVAIHEPQIIGSIDDGALGASFRQLKVCLESEDSKVWTVERLVVIVRADPYGIGKHSVIGGRRHTMQRQGKRNEDGKYMHSFYNWIMSRDGGRGRCAARCSCRCGCRFRW